MEELVERESMDFDVVIVGGGPSGLSAAIRLMQLAESSEQELAVCLVEKGSEIGAHVLSGAVFQPTALNELMPDWAELGAPVNNPVTDDVIYIMPNDKNRIRVPAMFVPKDAHNEGNHAISLGNLCRWMGEQAEGMGVNIFPGFAASEILYNEDGSVAGVATGDMGISADGERKGTYAPGYELRARYTIFAEGCRGHLGKQLMEKFELNEAAATQHYGIGFKELWAVDPSQAEQGKVIHSIGWPLGLGPAGPTGGTYLYHLPDNQVALGLIVDLSYSNPHLSPFDEFQRWKHHDEIAKVLEGGERISYGARAIVKGGIQALPKLTVPGAALTGDDAGFLNPLKIKGSHTAMKSGMLAAEAVFEELAAGNTGTEAASFQASFETSWLFDELNRARNVGPGLHKLGMMMGAAHSFVDQFFRGKQGWTLKDQTPDHATLKPAASAKKIDYPKPDGKISFDKLSSVFLSNTNHEEDQPCHLTLADVELPIRDNLPQYDEPAQRYCPAGVYEVIEEAGTARFQINAQNCVHCKTCDIKDPAQNITWVVPEGTGGPNYPNM
ncbi:MAG: electron transfer flavoprotein-ubiquinone oxidoreductase [Pseudomonadales bacterium]|nr:electron transfer flavoprotein-ubiquinone oxidoreductase [Pseudomonadales bacterium]